MKMLVLFQSGFLMAVYITLNLPKDSASVYMFPDDLALFQDRIFESVRTLAAFAFVVFMIQFYTDEPDHEKPAGIFVGTILGPLGVHLAANEEIWQRMDGGLRLMLVAIALFMLLVLLIKKGWGNAARFIISSGVFVSAFAVGLYSDRAQYAWVMFFASIVIVIPEIVCGLHASRVRAI